jgi:hypothetical protein
MTKSCSVLALVLISSISTFGQVQTQDDHDDLAPVQAGYAIVSPTFPTTSLVVTETFGLRKAGTTATQAGVVAPPLITSAFMFVDVSDRLLKNLGVSIVNPNAASADVTITLRRTDGTVLATKIITIPTRRQFVAFVTEIFPKPLPGDFGSGPQLPAEFRGTLAFTSTQPVSAIGLRFRGESFSTMPLIPVTVSNQPFPVIASGVGGAGAVLAPQFAAGGGWATELILTNAGPNTITVRVDIFRVDGTPLTTALNGINGSTFTNITILPGAVVVLAPRERNGDDDF